MRICRLFGVTSSCTSWSLCTPMQTVSVCYFVVRSSLRRRNRGSTYRWLGRRKFGQPTYRELPWLAYLEISNGSIPKCETFPRSKNQTWLHSRCSAFVRMYIRPLFPTHEPHNSYTLFFPPLIPYKYLFIQSIPCLVTSSIAFRSSSPLQSPLDANPCTCPS